MTNPDSGDITTLDQLVSTGSGERPVIGNYGPNMGSMTITARFAVAEITRVSVVANGLDAPDGEEIAQRALDLPHATKLAQFILRALVNTACRRYEVRGADVPQALSVFREKLGVQPYYSLPPIIASLRDAGPGGKNLRAVPITDGPNGERVAVRFWMRQDQLLYVVDGQHRRKAIEMVVDFLEGDVLQRRRYGKKNLYGNEGLQMSPEEVRAWDEVYHAARTEALIAVEIHLGLGVDQERQLFHDTNNLAKKVAPSLALSFDRANPINNFIKEVLEGRYLQIVDKDIAVADWNEDPGKLSRKDVVAINAHLILNKSNIKGAKHGEVEPRFAEAILFWKTVAAIPGFGEQGARAKTVAAQPVVLKALAKLMYDFAFGRGANAALRNRLIDGIGEIDFSHSNPVWGYFDLSAEAREGLGLQGLEQYLPPNLDGVNRDVGGRDGEGRMRFGAKHNDIFPILGDMIRWQLKLPNRHSQVVY